jgi:prepilin-type N-terminal cleavage/methylation domain-containing protein
MKKRHAFTLIELLVVISIIALLLSVLTPSLGKAKQFAKRVMCATGLRQVGMAMANYSMDDDKLPDALDVNGKPEFGHGYALYRGDKPQYSYDSGELIPLRWAKLYEGGYMDTPEIFYCLANRLDSYKYESYTNPEPWGTLPQEYNTQDQEGNPHNQWVRMGYTYFPLHRTRSKWDNGRVELAEKFTQLHPTLPYATDLIQGRSNLSHQRSQRDDDDTYEASKKYSVSALYSDAHVGNCNDPKVFSNDVWDRFRGGSVAYDEYYLTIFKLIGSE